MAYDDTQVTVPRSQEGIRKLLLGRKGSKVAFVTDPPREGFEAVVLIDESPYKIRIFGECRPAPETKARRGSSSQKATTEKFQRDFLDKEERRIWRVLFYHLKSVFEAADSGVMEFRSLLLPYFVTSSGETIAEQIIPKLEQAVAQHNGAVRLLGTGR